MKRQGRTRGVERGRSWKETLPPAKSFKEDSDGDVVMVTAEQQPQDIEYAEIGPDMKVTQSPIECDHTSVCECPLPSPCPSNAFEAELRSYKIPGISCNIKSLVYYLK